MNTHIVPLDFGGERILVAVIPSSGTEKTSAADRVKRAALTALDNAGDAIRLVAAQGGHIAREISETDELLKEVTLELGLAFTVDGNVVIAGGGVEASITISLHYDATLEH